MRQALFFSCFLLVLSCKQANHQTSLSEESELKSATKSNHPMALSCDKSSKMKKACDEAFADPSIQVYTHGQNRKETVSIQMDVGFHGFVDIGQKITLDIEFVREVSLRLVRASPDFGIDRIPLFVDDKLLYGTHNGTTWYASCEFVISGARIKNFESYQYVFRNGIKWNNQFIDVTTLARNFPFIVQRNPTRLSDRRLVSIHTRQMLFNSCLEPNNRLNQIRNALESDFKSIVHEYTAIPHGHSLWNQTGSLDVLVKFPSIAGKPQKIISMHAARGQRIIIPPIYFGHDLYIKYVNTCLAFRPKADQPHYQLVLKTLGIGGCNHAIGCVDVNNDDVWPAPHGDRWEGKCDDMDFRSTTHSPFDI